jgi:hypothetical protein
MKTVLRTREHQHGVVNVLPDMRSLKRFAKISTNVRKGETTVAMATQNVSTM